VLRANNFVAVAARRRIPIADIQRDFEYAAEMKWIEETENGSLRLTERGSNGDAEERADRRADAQVADIKSESRQPRMPASGASGLRKPASNGLRRTGSPCSAPAFAIATV
jgi:hypothetical protein